MDDKPPKLQKVPQARRTQSQTWQEQEFRVLYPLRPQSHHVCEVREARRTQFPVPSVPGWAPSPLGSPISRSLCPQHRLAFVYLPSTIPSHQSPLRPQASALRVFRQGCPPLHAEGTLLSDHPCSVHCGLSNLRSRTAPCLHFCFSHVPHTETVGVSTQEHLDGSINDKMNEQGKAIYMHRLKPTDWAL